MPLAPMLGMHENILNLLMGLFSGRGISGLFGNPVDQSGGMSVLSDEEMKKMAEEKKSTMMNFLDAINPYQFEYKDKEHGSGKQYGVMAQDLEKSKVGQSMVRNMKEGKMIDSTATIGPTLASLGYIHERLKKLEGKKHA